MSLYFQSQGREFEITQCLKQEEQNSSFLNLKLFQQALNQAGFILSREEVISIFKFIYPHDEQISKTLFEINKLTAIFQSRNMYDLRKLSFVNNSSVFYAILEAHCEQLKFAKTELCNAVENFCHKSQKDHQ